MHRNLLEHSVGWGLVCACLCTMSNGTTAGSFTRGCAARDLQILILIEDRENTEAISTEASSDAMLAMLEARIVAMKAASWTPWRSTTASPKALRPTRFCPLGGKERSNET